MDEQQTTQPQNTTPPTTQPTQAPMQQPTQNSTLRTEITYSVGLLAKPLPGTITYDGNGLIQLVDTASSTAIFSKNIQELGKVTRAEYAIYMNVPGMKKVTVMFGNSKRYITENAAAMPFGIPGAAIGVIRSNKLNEQSGLQAWVDVFKAHGKINNFSPNMLVLVSVILGVVIFAVSMLSFFFQ